MSAAAVSAARYFRTRREATAWCRNAGLTPAAFTLTRVTVWYQLGPARVWCLRTAD